MESLLVVLAIVVSIALGYRTKINTGLFGIAFAYLIGAFVLDLSPGAIISMWPVRIFFVILSVSLFYNFATINGTMEKLANRLLYAIRKIPVVLPYAVYLIATLVAALGAGYFTVLAFFAPITLLLCDKTGQSKLTGAVAVNYGALAGANFMTAPSGIIFKGLVEEAGYLENTWNYTAPIFITTFLLPFVMITLFHVFFSRKKSEGAVTAIAMDKPEPFSPVQRTTFFLIIAMVVLVLIGPILTILFPGVEVFEIFNRKIDIGLIAIIFSIIALFLKLAKQSEVIAKVPWPTLIMICGVGMLISVAIEAGTIDLLASWIATNIPVFLVPVILAIVGGFMSFFSSTLGVVAPALFPTIPALAAATGFTPAALFVAIIIGAQATSISPFSSGGSLILGSTPEGERDHVFHQLMFKAAPLCLLGSVVVSFFVATLF